MSSRPPTSTQPEPTNHAHASFPSPGNAMAKTMLPSFGSLPFHSPSLKAKPSATLPPLLHMPPTYISPPTQPRLQHQSTLPPSQSTVASYGGSDWNPLGPVPSGTPYGTTGAAYRGPQAPLSDPPPRSPFSSSMTTPYSLRASAFPPPVLQPNPIDRQPRFDPFTQVGRTGPSVVSSPPVPRLGGDTPISLGSCPGGLIPQSMPQVVSGGQSEHTEDR